MRKKPTPTSRSHSCAVAARSPCAAGESLHSATLTLPGAFQNPLGIGPPSAEEIPSMSPASSRYQRSRSSQTLQDHPEDDPPQGAQPDPETLSDSSLACEILSQQPRNKTWSASETAAAASLTAGHRQPSCREQLDRAVHQTTRVGLTRCCVMFGSGHHVASALADAVGATNDEFLLLSSSWLAAHQQPISITRRQTPSTRYMRAKQTIPCQHKGICELSR